MNTKKKTFLMSILVFAILTGCSDDKNDEFEISDINLTEITDNTEMETVAAEEENTGETDNDNYEVGGYITIVNDDGKETNYYFCGGSESGAYADYTEDNDMGYTEYQNNLYERQDEIVKGERISDETVVSPKNMIKQ